MPLFLLPLEEDGGDPPKNENKGFLSLLFVYSDDEDDDDVKRIRYRGKVRLKGHEDGADEASSLSAEEATSEATFITLPLSSISLLREENGLK